METRLEAVRRILNTASDQIFPGNPSHSGLGRFWNLPRDTFVNAVVEGLQVIVLGKPDESAMIKALKGLPPFDGPPFGRMPQGRPPVADADIAFIAQWIKDGCPETDTVTNPPKYP
jgi:tyrosinase